MFDPPEDFNLADYYLFDRVQPEAGVGLAPHGLHDKTAIVFGAQRHSYGDVAKHTRALAAHLIRVGVKREQRVLTILHDTPAFAWSFFATLRIGAVVAMGNPAAPVADLDYLVRYTRAAAVVTTPEVAVSIADALGDLGCHVVLAKQVATGEDVLSSVAIASELGNVDTVTLPNAIAAGHDRIAIGGASARATQRDDTAIWLFTSGSTGRSKAAMHTHRDFAFNTERYALRTVGYRNDDVTVSVPRLFFGYATGTNLMFPFRVGATTGLFAERPTPAALANAIERYKPTIVTNVPTMMGKLLDDDDTRRSQGEAPIDLASVRFHLSAGEALPPALLTRFSERFGCNEVYDGIGSAEMFHIYCTNRPGDVKPASLGRVVEGYSIKLLPADATAPGAEPVPVGESGVMWVKGDSVALGYFQDRAKSWETFHGHWCRTGDMFRCDADGYYWFEGRADDLLKVGGVWVAPTEVENCISAHDGVSQVAVIGAELDGLIKPKAFVMLREGQREAIADADRRAALAQSIKDHVKERLSKHKYPRWVVFVDELPKNDRGKIARKVLAQREASGDNPKGC